MGFDFYGHGLIKECWATPGFIHYSNSLTGFVVDFPTEMQENIPKQRNLFHSDWVLFVLYSDTCMYVGRRDGMISIYRRSDDMLTGLKPWTPPKYKKLEVIGYYRGLVGPEEIYLDPYDTQTIYTQHDRRESALPKHAAAYTFDNPAAIFASKLSEKGTASVYEEGGEQISVSPWNIQDGLRRQDNLVFL